MCEEGGRRGEGEKGEEARLRRGDGNEGEDRQGGSASDGEV